MCWVGGVWVKGRVCGARPAGGRLGDDGTKPEDRFRAEPGRVWEARRRARQKDGLRCMACTLGGTAAQAAVWWRWSAVERWDDAGHLLNSTHNATLTSGADMSERHGTGPQLTGKMELC